MPSYGPRIIATGLSRASLNRLSNHGPSSGIRRTSAHTVAPNKAVIKRLASRRQRCTEAPAASSI